MLNITSNKVQSLGKTIKNQIILQQQIITGNQDYQTIISTINKKPSLSASQLIITIRKMMDVASFDNESIIRQSIITLMNKDFNKRQVINLLRNTEIDQTFLLAICWKHRKQFQSIQLVDLIFDALPSQLILRAKPYLSKWQTYLETLLNLQKQKCQITRELNKKIISNNNTYFKDYFIKL